MNKTDRVLQLIKDAQIAVDQELERCCNGADTVGTFHQLSSIQKKLEEMKISITHGTMPLQHSRNSGMGRMIVDSWPLDSTLGELVISAEKAYVRL